MRYLKNASPMLINAFAVWMIHRQGVGHEFLLGACFGGSVAMAVVDATRPE